KLLEEFRVPLQKSIDTLLPRLYAGLEEEDDDDNYSVYTGTSGIALLHLHLHLKSDRSDRKQLEKVESYLKHPLRHLKGRRLSFLCGDAGPLALGTVVYHLLGKEKECSNCLKKLILLHQRVIEPGSRIPDEILYGRSGYLYALLFVQKHLGKDEIDSSLIVKVCKAILDSGETLAKAERWQHPLMYQWHEKHYLGAAHGLAGIFYMLMQVDDPVIRPYLESLVRPSVDYMLTLRFPSGNCPSSIGSSTGDKLIHWCHGAPGWIHMFILAYKIFSDTKYLDAAKSCADVIWTRGVLRKGYGMCHGTAGNGYALLAMYKLTKDQSYLHKAYKFAEWCFDYGKHGCGTPDTPFSLFEGMAGTIYFLIDLLDPVNSAFPAFEL
ncbi:hypothetical protein FSP39_012525, partial [Pinctada imbricata]